MNKSKYEPPDYLAFYNAAVAAYAKTVLGANQVMLGYTVAATRTMLRATAFATPVAPATLPHVNEPAATGVVASDQQAELAQIEAALYADEAKLYSTESTVDETLRAEALNAEPAVGESSAAAPLPAKQAVSEPIVTEPAIEPTKDSLETMPSSRANRSKKEDTRRRRGKK